jgi:hypothetical protein
MYRDRETERLSEKQEVIIRFYRHFNKWRFSIECGKYRIGGMANGLSEAEQKADFALSGLPEYGIINRVYEGG